VELKAAIPGEFKLIGKYHNPFKGTTRIRIYLSRTIIMKLSIFNIRGTKVFSEMKYFLSQGLKNENSNLLTTFQGYIYLE
jgi:hypothetical protein